MTTKGGLFRAAGDIFDALNTVDRNYFIIVEDGKIFVAQDNESWSPKLQVWPEEDA